MALGSLRRTDCYDVQGARGVGRDAPGNVTLQPDALIGMNAAVLGVAWMGDSDGSNDPSERESALAHV